MFPYVFLLNSERLLHHFTVEELLKLQHYKINQTFHKLPTRTIQMPFFVANSIAFAREIGACTQPCSTLYTLDRRHFFQQLPVSAIIHSFQCCVVFVSLGNARLEVDNARLEVDNAEHGIHLANLQDAVSGGWSTSRKAQHKMALYCKYLN